MACHWSLPPTQVGRRPMGHRNRCETASTWSVRSSPASRYSTSAARRATASPTGCTVSCATRCQNWSGSTSTRASSASSRTRTSTCAWQTPQNFDLGRTFDTVFAGELIEHLGNVDGFLSSARRHLEPGGQLVLTTPNVFYVGNFVYRWGGHGKCTPSTRAGIARTRCVSHRAQRLRQRRDLIHGALQPDPVAQDGDLFGATHLPATPVHGHDHRGSHRRLIVRALRSAARG